MEKHKLQIHNELPHQAIESVCESQDTVKLTVLTVSAVHSTPGTRNRPVALVGKCLVEKHKLPVHHVIPYEAIEYVVYTRLCPHCNDTFNILHALSQQGDCHLVTVILSLNDDINNNNNDNNNNDDNNSNNSNNSNNHDELGTCRTSLVSPKLSVLRIFIRSTISTLLTITQRNNIETRPGAARWARPLDLKDKP